MEARGYSVGIRYSRVCKYAHVMEIIGECPKENASRASERLQEVMVGSAATVCSVPMKCDCYQLFRWYLDDFSDYINNSYHKAIEKEKVAPEEARARLHKEYNMITDSVLDSMIDGTIDISSCTEI